MWEGALRIEANEASQLTSRARQTGGRHYRKAKRITGSVHFDILFLTTFQGTTARSSSVQRNTASLSIETTSGHCAASHFALRLSARGPRMCDVGEGG